MDFVSFLIQTLNSLQYGLLLFLVASGLTLVFGIMGIINLAHGSFYMVGAYLAFVLTSATDEEIMFRGLFLRKLEPFVGAFLANCLVALVFTGLHAVVTYTSDQLGFLAATLPLAIAWGYIMQKTDGIWGSILFHAGMDIPIVLGLFSVAS